MHRLLIVVIGMSLAAGCRPASSGVAQASATADSEAKLLRLGSPAASSATPVLASSGRWVVAAWTETQDGRTNVYAATSDDGAVHFGSAVRVNDVDGEVHVYGEDPPRVAIDRSASSNGTPPEILVTWPSDRQKKLGMRSARSTDGGRAFSPSVSIGDPEIQGERGFQSVTVGGDRVVRAAWLDQRRDPGTSHHANTGNDWDPMHLMYASGSRDGWNPETRLASNVCGCCKTAIATGPDGAVYVAWRNIYPGDLRDISFAVARDGRTFSAPVRVSQDHWSINACPDDGPTMQVDLSGTVHIVWPTLVDGPEPAMRFFHASTRDGVTFTARQPIPTLGTPKPSHPQMTVDQCGTLTLVWDETRGSSRRVFMRRLVPQESGDVHVGHVQVLSAETSAVYPVIAPVDGGMIAAWTEVTTASDRSRVALRRVNVAPMCQPRDANGPAQ